MYYLFSFIEAAGDRYMYLSLLTTIECQGMLPFVHQI